MLVLVSADPFEAGDILGTSAKWRLPVISVLPSDLAEITLETGTMCDCHPFVQVEAKQVPTAPSIVRFCKLETKT